MAYTNPLHIANGLILDFTIDAANTGSDSFLGVDADGSITKFASVPASRVSAGGNLTEATSSVLTITGGSGALLSNATIQVKLAGAGQSGYLSSTDWNTFNNKLGTSLTSAYVFVGNGSNVATGVAISGDISINNSGVVAIATGVIVNADINASAAIALSKLAALTASRAIVSDGSGFLTISSTTATQIGYLNSVTSNVQTQLNNKLSVTLTSPSAGDVITYDGASWVNTPSNSLPSGGSQYQILRKASATNYDVEWHTIVTADITDISASYTEINKLSGVTTSTAQLNYLNTTTSNIQTQIDGKLTNSLTTNYMWVGNGSNQAGTIAPGTNGYVLTSSGGVPVWAAPSGISGLTASRIPYATSSTSIADDSKFTWDSTDKVLTIDGIRIFSGDTAGPGNDNLVIGNSALTGLSATMVDNVAIGPHTLENLDTVGSNNTAIGTYALNDSVNGFNNTAVGFSALGSALGDQNTAIGSSAGSNVSTGTDNIAIGYASNSGTTGDNNIAIGANSSVNSNTTSNQLVIQNAIYGVDNSGTGATISTGHIGIYQKVPTHHLHITGHSANQNLFLVEENGGTNIFEIVEQSGTTKIGFFAASPVAQQSGLTSITHTSPGSPDYNIQDLTNAGGYGFVTKDEGNTVLSVVKAMQDALKLYGLIS